MKRYNLHVDISKSDATGEAMRRMISGTCSTFDSVKAAERGMEKLFILFAQLKSGLFASYGAAYIVNETKGEMVGRVRHIPNPDKLVDTFDVLEFNREV